MKSPAVPRAELAQHHADRGGERPAAPAAAARPRGTARSPTAGLRTARRGRELRLSGRLCTDGKRGVLQGSPWQSVAGAAGPAAARIPVAGPPAFAGEALTVPCLRSPLPGQGSQLSPARSSPGCPALEAPDTGARLRLQPPRVPLPRDTAPGCPLPDAGLPHASPSALRSSSKFSLLLIFQVPAKLGMAGGRCGRRRGRGAAAPALSPAQAPCERGAPRRRLGERVTPTRPPTPSPGASTTPPDSRPPSQPWPRHPSFCPSVLPVLHPSLPACLAARQLPPGASQEGEPDCHLSHSWGGH